MDYFALLQAAITECKDDGFIVMPEAMIDRHPNGNLYLLMSFPSVYPGSMAMNLPERYLIQQFVAQLPESVCKSLLKQILKQTMTSFNQNRASLAPAMFTMKHFKDTNIFEVDYTDADTAAGLKKPA